MLTEEQIRDIVAKCPPMIPRKKVPTPEEELKVASEKALSYEQEVRRAERMRLRQEEIRKQEEERVYWERRRALEAHQGMQAAIMNAEYEAKQKGRNLGAYDPFARFDREMRGDND